MKIFPLFVALLLSQAAKANFFNARQFDTLPMIYTPSLLLAELSASINEMQNLQIFDAPAATRHTDFLESQHSPQSFGIQNRPQSFESQHFTFKSYPNPVVDRILIEVQMTTDVLRKSMIELADETGNIVRNVPCLPRMSLYVDDLPQGKYTIGIKTNGRTQASEPIEIKR
jgi:hypothetical protein